MKTLVTLAAALVMAAPTIPLSGDGTVVIPAADIKTQLADLAIQAKPTGSAGPVVASYGNLLVMLSVRTANGVGELHEHYDDLMVVQQGTATLITGGSLVDPKTTGPGEIRGKSVQGGKSRTISVGDVVVIPANVPHQILLQPGMIYSASIGKIKEP